MPRLTKNAYIRRHNVLAAIAEQESLLLTALSPTAQWELHEYYAPFLPLSRKELLTRRARLDRRQPSLGARAGKHCMFLLRLLDHIAAVRGAEALADGSAVPLFMAQLAFGEQHLHQTSSNEQKMLSVRAQVKPHRDAQQLAKIFLLQAADEARRAAKGQQADADQSDAA